VNPPYPADARWIIQPLLFAGNQTPILISEPIPGVGEGAGAMGLFHLDDPPGAPILKHQGGTGR